MKRIVPFLVLLVLLATSVWAQGPLSPPGAPGQTMKSLAQIEPRTLIESLPFTITTPGSYYLTGNLTSAGNGIVVESDNVTIDLMGFTLTGSGSGGGIYAWPNSGGYQGLVVKDGGITGFNAGIQCMNVEQLSLTDLMVTSNATYGIYCKGQGESAGNNRIEDCTIVRNGGVGLFLQSYVVEDSSDGNLIRDCLILQNASHGIELDGSSSAQCNGNRIEDSTVSKNGGSGIYLFGTSGACNGNAIRNCTIAGNAANGVQLTAECKNNRIEGNAVTANATGLNVYGSGNFVADNTVSGNVLNYDFSQDNQLNLQVCEVPETLRWPCSAKLAGTLTLTQADTNAITVVANDVAIDLAGHSLIGPASGVNSGIYYKDPENVWIGLRNVSARNGHIQRFCTGISASCSPGRFENLCISSNLQGIVLLGYGSSIEHCSFAGNQYSIVLSHASGNRIVNNAIAGQWGSSWENETWGIGYTRWGTNNNGNTIADCTIRDVTYGIGSIGATGGGSDAGNTIMNCTLSDIQGIGISIGDGGGNRIENNNIRGLDSSGYGIWTGPSNNVIVRNTVMGFITNYNMGAGDTYGPIVTNSGVLATSGEGAHPWANFSR